MFDQSVISLFKGPGRPIRCMVLRLKRHEFIHIARLMHRLGGDMNDAVVGYRVKLVLTSLCVAASTVLVGRFLPAGLQTFAWGVAAGLSAMLTIIVVGWLLKGSEPADPVEVRRNI